MNYTIRNDKIEVTVNDYGAELQSIRMLSDGREYLWQGNAEYWASRACILFPICGRLTEGKYTYQGKTYEMNIHGFARKQIFEMLESKDDEISFRLTANETLKAQYPFDFELIMKYRLHGYSVDTVFCVRNNGIDQMIFAVGGHPGFNVPLNAGESFDDYYLEFDEVKPTQAINMSETCFYLGSMRDFPLRDGKILDLHHELFDHDAIFLHGMSHGVTLRSRKSPYTVHLSYPDMQYLGFWHKPQSDAPYVCIEPWYSVPADDLVVDDLMTKREMLRLDPGKEYENCFTITVS